jgi:transposase InsO family protein
MQQYNKTKGIKGIVSLYQDALRFRDMITPKAEERVRILAFWKKHGDAAAKEAFKVSRATLFRWQKILSEGGGKLESLVPKSTAPKVKRQRIIPKPVADLILAERKMEKIGKEKLALLLKEDHIAALSSSTVGRMLADLKRAGKLKNPHQLSLSGKTGNLIEKKPRNTRKKLRSKGHEGQLAKADTIVRFTNGIKRYILTGIDCESEFAFAYAYPSHSSKTAADFMRTFKDVAPLALTHVQTDNGSEFADHFEIYLEHEGIVHFHTYPRSPKMNAEIERFNRTLSEAFMAQHRMLLAYDLDTFNKALMDWLIWYNTRRPHWSIGLIPPLRYIVKNLPAPESQMCWTNTPN